MVGWVPTWAFFGSHGVRKRRCLFFLFSWRESEDVGCRRMLMGILKPCDVNGHGRRDLAEGASLHEIFFFLVFGAPQRNFLRWTLASLTRKGLRCSIATPVSVYSNVSATIYKSIPSRRES